MIILKSDLDSVDALPGIAIQVIMKSITHTKSVQD